MSKKTLVLGATTNPGRYAYIAARQLMGAKHPVVLVGIDEGEINGVPIQKEFPGPEEGVDTITLYVGPKRQPQYYDAIINSGAKRIIFNPGTENPELYRLAAEKGIEVEIACTLVMLSTRQY